MRHYPILSSWVLNRIQHNAEELQIETRDIHEAVSSAVLSTLSLFQHDPKTPIPKPRKKKLTVFPGKSISLNNFHCIDALSSFSVPSESNSSSSSSDSCHNDTSWSDTSSDNDISSRDYDDEAFGSLAIFPVHKQEKRMLRSHK